MNNLENRARAIWLLLLASAILWLPVLITLPLALFWRGRAQGTVYASHFRAIVRYCWIVVVLPIVLLALPSLAASLVVGAIVMFVFAYAALDGMRRASRGDRYKGLFA